VIVEIVVVAADLAAGMEVGLAVLEIAAVNGYSRGISDGESSGVRNAHSRVVIVEVVVVVLV